MKKLVLLLILVFGFVSSTNANQEMNLIHPSPNKVIVDNYWIIAEAIEAVHCGYVGCDYDWFVYAFEACENSLQE